MHPARMQRSRKSAKPPLHASTATEPLPPDGLPATHADIEKSSNVSGNASGAPAPVTEDKKRAKAGLKRVLPSLPLLDLSNLSDEDPATRRIYKIGVSILALAMVCFVGFGLSYYERWSERTMYMKAVSEYAARYAFPKGPIMEQQAMSSSRSTGAPTGIQTDVIDFSSRAGPQVVEQTVPVDAQLPPPPPAPPAPITEPTSSSTTSSLPYTYLREDFAARGTSFHMPENISGIQRVHYMIHRDQPSSHIVIDDIYFSNKGQAFIGSNSHLTCGGYSRSLLRECSSLESTAYKDGLIRSSPLAFGKQTWDMAHENLQVIPGNTLLQVMDRSCSNIGHFAGRLLYTYHIWQNSKAYSIDQFDKVILLVETSALSRFTKKDGSWQRSFTEALFYPHEVTIRSMEGLFDSQYEVDSNGRATTARKQPRIFVIESFAQITNEISWLRFEKLTIVGYLKSRFFIDDVYYPSERPRYIANFQTAFPLPTITRDSLLFREAIGTYLSAVSNGGAPKYRPIEKRIAFMIRKGKRRNFNPETKTALLALLQEKASKHRYTVDIMEFDSMTPLQQMDSLRNVAIAIGPHGANLVNCIFMPPLSAMIELFPYAFLHDMYFEGGMASIKYYTVSASLGTQFPEQRPGETARDCIRKSSQCKVFYRDADIQYNEQDISTFGEALDSALMYLMNIIR